MQHYAKSTTDSSHRTSRGIGLELVKQLLADPSNFVVATCRTPDKATALHALKEGAKGTLHVVALDVADEASIRNSRAAVEEALGGRGLDYLYNNAAIVRNAPLPLSRAHFAD